MSGNIYEKVMAQLNKQGTLRPDTNLLFNLSVEEQPSVVSEIMTQLSLKVGLKTLVEKRRKSMELEMRLLHLRETVEPRDRHELSTKEKDEVLESQIFLKLKRDCNIKGQAVAGGNKQRDSISKEEASPPTVATEVLLLSCVIDAEEHLDIS